MILTANYVRNLHLDVVNNNDRLKRRAVRAQQHQIQFATLFQQTINDIFEVRLSSRATFKRIAKARRRPLG